MTKIAHFADIHISDSRIGEFEKLLEQLGTSIKEQQPDLIVFAGDMFTHRDKLSQMQVQLTRNFFKETLEGYPIIIVPGNHDASMSEFKVDSLSAIFAKDGQIKVHSKIGEYVDINGTRFHMFPYPSKKELVRLGINDVTDVGTNQTLLDNFKLSSDLKNVLVYHGTLEEFSYSDTFIASEQTMGIGKDLSVPKTFWAKFDAVFAGHLHKKQQIEKAAYPGSPFPLNFTDSAKTGWLLWTDLEPEFIRIDQLYPYITYDVGDLGMYKTGLTEEAVRRVKNEHDHTGARVRIKYLVKQAQSGEVNHTKLSQFFKNATEIKIVPEYRTAGQYDSISFEDFQDNTVQGVIEDYIKDRGYNPKVAEIAKEIEATLLSQFAPEDEKGVHFKLQKLRLNNFKCYGTNVPEIDFTQLAKVVGIFGPNKSGKSSLIESIIWAIFGTTMRNKIRTSIIRNGEAKCTVEVEFESNGNVYKAVRTRTKQSGTLKLYKWVEDTRWGDVSGADIPTTQASINRLVGSFDMFTSTVYSPQNKIDLLVSKRPSERKQVILDCLQIDILERRNEAIAVMKKTAQETVSQLKGKVSAFSEQLSLLERTRPNDVIREYNMLVQNEKANQVKYTTHIENLGQRIHTTSHVVADYDSLNDQITVIRTDLLELDNKIMRKQYTKDTFEAAMEDTSIVDRGLERQASLTIQENKYATEKYLNSERNNQINQLTHEHKKLTKSTNETIGALEQTVTTIENQIANLKRLDCPRGTDCPLDQKIVEQQKQLRLQIENVSESITLKRNELQFSELNMSEQIARLKLQLSESFYTDGKYMEYVRALKEERINKWEELFNKLSSGREILEGMIELVLALTEQRIGLRSKRDDLINQRGDLAEQMGALDGNKQELKNTRNDLTECNKKIDHFEHQISKAEYNLTEINKLQGLLDEYHTKLLEGEEYVKHCQKYANIVSKSGVIFSLVDKALPIIESFAQNLLSQTTNGTISVSIDGYKTLSSGDKADEISIYISDAKGKRDVQEGSGAETVLVSLALRAAMSFLLSLRMGSHVELFIIDEGMGALDDEQIIAVKDIFKRLGDKFNQVLFITHVAELKDVAQSIINVKSNSLTSTFEIKEMLNA